MNTLKINVGTQETKYGGVTPSKLEETYDYLTDITGHLPYYVSLTNCMYDGNPNLSLEEAQNKKFDFIIQSLGITPGKVILEIGCGNGQLASYCKTKGVRVVGITPVKKQYDNCVKNGLEVYRTLYQDFIPKESYDGVVAMGLPEHLCSYNDKRSGKQVDRYHEFFTFCKKVTKPGSKLYFQAMLFFEDNIPDLEDMLKPKKKGDPLFYYHLLTYFYPDSWLGTLSQYQKAATGIYETEKIINGREDYIITMTEWGRIIMKFSFSKKDIAKWWLFIKLLVRSIFDFRLRMQIYSALVSANKMCFVNKTMDHIFSVWKRAD